MDELQPLDTATRNSLLKITPELLKQFLHLPEHVTIDYALGGTDECRSIQLVVSSPNFKEVDEGDPIPVWNPTYLASKTCPVCRHSEPFVLMPLDQVLAKATKTIAALSFALTL